MEWQAIGGWVISAVGALSTLLGGGYWVWKQKLREAAQAETIAQLTAQTAAGQQRVDMAKQDDAQEAALMAMLLKERERCAGEVKEVRAELLRDIVDLRKHTDDCFEDRAALRQKLAVVEAVAAASEKRLAKVESQVIPLTASQPTTINVNVGPEQPPQPEQP